ncbi:hypothetical protein M5K25_002678 [Dendrobium thyrsiflorum]|uniref:Uncharacterized protein n=1 Tax=Dendrobium thyrsiflorum TaxID=117978 RepID=A0ABD0VNA6_DENTH
MAVNVGLKTADLLIRRGIDVLPICSLCLDLICYGLLCGSPQNFGQNRCIHRLQIHFFCLFSFPYKRSNPITNGKVGAYRDPVHMLELDHLLRSRCKDYWKERLREERAEMVKQAKQYWEKQTITALGY